MNQEIQNALAFYEPAPAGDYSGVSGKWQWLWETLQGDFNEEPTTGQIVTGAVISMIPVVDQIGDIRDLIANCRKINEDTDDSWAWVALALTLIGLFPVLGSLVKGAFKVLFYWLRRSIFRAGVRGFDVNARAVASWEAVAGLSRYFDMPPVRKTLAMMKVRNPYTFLAGKLDEIRAMLTVKDMLKVMDDLLQVTRDLMNGVVKWGPASLKDRVEAVWSVLLSVRNKAGEGLGAAFKSIEDTLEQLANRLRVEGDSAYRALPGDNLHVLGNERQAAERIFIEKYKPDWVDSVKKETYPALENFDPENIKYIDQGWPQIGIDSGQGRRDARFRTFDKTLRAELVPPGERLFRVVDPSSADNSYYWLREADFNELKTKSQWRRELAVWKAWNENGEYLIYKVPLGQPLKVWEGRAATQSMNNSSYKLEGGRSQVLLDPTSLDPGFLSSRKRTGWKYDDGTSDAELDSLKPYVGLPELTHKWYVPKSPEEK
jgi:hypothetical protein